MELPNFNGHLPSLDGLRGMAILLVMIHHFTVVVPVNQFEVWFTKASQIGMHGVDLFFVLSGFLITGILLESKGQPKFLRNFYMRRTLRIFPLYYAIVGFSFILLPILFGKIGIANNKLIRFDAASDDWVWYVTYCSNFLIAKVNAFRHGILDVTWSLAIEEQFYIVWATAVLFLGRKGLKRACVAMICGALVLRLVMWFVGYSWLQIYVLTPCRMDGLALGSLLAVYVRSSAYDPKQLTTVARKVAFALTFVLLGFFCFDFLIYTSSVSYTIGYTLVSVLLAQILILVLHAPPTTLVGKIFAGGFLRFFGKYSYAIYLFHLPIRAAIRDLFFGDAQFRQLIGPAIAWQLVFYVLATLAVIPPALISWHFFEKRFLKLKAFFPSGVGVGTIDKQVSAFAGDEIQLKAPSQT